MKRRALGLSAAISIACACAEEEEEELECKENGHQQSRKRLKWTRELFLSREDSGFFKELNCMLRNNDPELFKNFVRMDASDFDLLVDLVGPSIKKKDKRFRKAISAAERMAVTLRFLATGDSYGSLMYLFRMSKASISNIVMETCQALYDTLKNDYMKVNILNFIIILIISSFVHVIYILLPILFIICIKHCLQVILESHMRSAVFFSST